jgi:hypothetical protein
LSQLQADLFNETWDEDVAAVAAELEQLDVAPAVFTVHRHIRPQYACINWETITAAPIPVAVINPRKRSLPTDKHGFTRINNWLYQFFVTPFG